MYNDKKNSSVSFVRTTERLTERNTRYSYRCAFSLILIIFSSQGVWIHVSCSHMILKIRHEGGLIYNPANVGAVIFRLSVDIQMVFY